MNGHDEEASFACVGDRHGISTMDEDRSQRRVIAGIESVVKVGGNMRISAY